MRILLFGRDGQVGSCLRAAHGSHELIPLGRAEADLLKPGAASSAVISHKPDIVINAAAYTAVDKAENDEAAALRINGEAPGEIALAAKRAGATFIHLSTDYVFSGEHDGPYKETDDTAPLNIYGRTKLSGERAALENNPASIIIRTSWVFSEFGANFVKTMLRLAETKSDLDIVSDQVGGPTDAHEIATAILNIAEKKARGAPGDGVYHYQGTPAISWAGFAEHIFEAAGKTVTIRPIPTAKYPTPARRPLRTVLDCGRMERDFGIAQPDWRIGLQRVIAALGD